MKNVIVTLFCVLITLSCREDFVTDAQKNIELPDFPTHFENLESDIIYKQNKSIVYIEKESQIPEILPITIFRHSPEIITWSSDGHSIYFIDRNLNSSDPGPLFNYNFNEKKLLRISNRNWTHYSISNDNKAFILEDIGFWGIGEKTIVLYDPENGMEWDLIQYVHDIFLDAGGDTVIVGNTYGFSWVNTKQIQSEYSYHKMYQDSIVSKTVRKKVILEYDNTKLSVSRIEDNFSWDRVNYNSDSTHAILIKWDANYRDLLYVVDTELRDTVLLSNDVGYYPTFSPNEKYVLFYEYIVEVQKFVNHKIYYVYDIEGRHSYNIFPEAFDVKSVSFSPSERQIVCLAHFWEQDNYESYYNVFVMSIDGTNPTMLSDPNVNSRNKYPSFRPY